MIPDANEPRLLVSDGLEERIKHLVDEKEYKDLPRNVKLIFGEITFLGVLEGIERVKRKLIIGLSIDDQSTHQLAQLIMNDQLPAISALGRDFKPQQIKKIKIDNLVSPVGAWMSISIAKE